MLRNILRFVGLIAIVVAILLYITIPYNEGLKSTIGFLIGIAAVLFFASFLKGLNDV